MMQMAFTQLTTIRTHNELLYKSEGNRIGKQEKFNENDFELFYNPNPPPFPLSYSSIKQRVQ